MYILTDQNDRTLYIGVTGDLPRRLREHRNGETKSDSYTVPKTPTCKITNPSPIL